jgi:hypothetical protein
MTSIGRKQHSPNSQKLRTLLAVILIAVWVYLVLDWNTHRQGAAEIIFG